MPPERITRRQALGAGAAALAAGGLAPGAAAAARRPALFELALDGGDLGASASAASAGGWRTTPVLKAPRRFDLLGLRWARGGRLEAQVRARRRHGAWSPWVTLKGAGDHAPDSGTRLAGTEPAWTDTADLFQLRLRGHARGLRVRFVRAKPTATVARGVSKRLRRRATASAARSRARSAQAGPPRIITRTEWGADSVPPRSAPDYGEVQLAFVHHTVTANDYAPEDSPAIVLGIARYHRDSNKWNDIGYNFLVDKYGQVFEGRAGGMDQAVIGAQAQGYNSTSTGVACLGDFSAIPQSDAGIAALAQLLGWKLAVHGVPATGQVTVTSQGGASNRYPSGTPVTFERISGHRDGDETSCPGNGLYAQLPRLREETARRYGGAGGGGVPSALSLRAAAKKVKYPAPVRVDGKVSFEHGQSPAGLPVVVEFQSPGAGWQPVGTATSAADGRWAAQAALPHTGLLRARFAGDDMRPPLEAAPVEIVIVPKLAMALSARRVRRRSSVKVTGTLTPSPAGGKVECRVERQVRGRWVLVQTKRINVRRGAFRTGIRPRLPGLYRVSVVTPGATKRLRLRVLEGRSRTGGASAA